MFKKNHWEEVVMGVLETFVLAGGMAATKAAASTLVKKSASKFMQEYFEPILKKKKAKQKLFTDAKNYINRLDKATRAISTVAISGPKSLDDIYVPLTLIGRSESDSLKLDGFPEKLFRKSRCVLLTDTAGMGKSTAARFIVQASLVSLKVLPIWVELRRIESGKSLIEHISFEMFGKSSQDEYDLLIGLLSDGDVLVLLDGYDEIDDALRIKINGEIHDLSVRFDSCWFLVASRPDSQLKGLSQFDEYNIRPLDSKEAFELIKKYDPKNNVSDRLIAKVKSNSQIKEFLTNPLLVSLLFRAFDYKATIPLKRHIFFRQVFDALYQDHDLSKGAAFERKKKTGLDIEDFHKAVRALGIATHFVGRVQYGPEEFQSLLDGARTISAPVFFDLSKMRSDLLSAVPVFTKDGMDVRWSHKAFQDYFAAQYIYFDANKGRDELVLGLLDSENPRKNENILQILVDLDREIVEKLVIAPMIEELMGHYEGFVANGGLLDFETFQCLLAGDLWFLPKSVGEHMWRQSGPQSELHKIFREIGDANPIPDNPVRMATSADAGKNASCMVVFNRLNDNLNLILNLLGFEAKARRPSNMLSAMGDTCEFGECPRINIWSLFSLGKISQPEVRGIFESTHGLNFLDENTARRILASAKVDRPYGATWLESIVRTAKTAE